MIRIGVCAAIDQISLAAAAGYDYLEAGFAGIASLPEEEFKRQLSVAKASSISVEACNGMLTAQQRVTGPDVDLNQVEGFITRGFDRAEQLGVKVVVFGSSGARNVPEGWSYHRAWQQISEYLRMAEPVARAHGITIALEPLCRAESNILHYVSEGTLLSAMLDLPNLRTLGDIYHMVLNGEPMSALTDAGSLLAHTHIANPEGRLFPSGSDSFDYVSVFKALKAGGYDARMSVEGRALDFQADLPVACRVLKKARDMA